MRFATHLTALRRYLRNDRKARRCERRTWRLGLERLEDRQMLSIDLTSVGQWIERGPRPIQDNGNSDTNGSILNDVVVGAVEALAPHPTDRNILYAGTVNGGVWKTTNAYAADPHWTPLTDQLPSLSIGALAFSPLDGTHQTLYAGIGNTSNNGRNGGSLSGPPILRTSDGGATWTQFGAGGPLSGLNIDSILPTRLGGSLANQVVLVAAHDWGAAGVSIFDPTDSSTKSGVYLSSNGGQTFAKVLAGIATQIIADPGDPTGMTFYAGLAGKNGVSGVDPEGVFKSTNGGVSWTAVNTGISGAGDSVRIELSSFNSATQNLVFAAVIGTDSRLSGIFRSANQGATWAPLDSQLPQINSEEGQGGINISIAVNPNNANEVYVGGEKAIAQWIPNAPLGAQHWVNLPGPHPDSRDMAFDKDGQLLESDDGGIYRRVNGTWFSVIGDLGCTEILSVAYDAMNDKVFAGAQDNARIEELGPNSGLKVWDSWGTGDGGNVGIGYVGSGAQRQAVRYGIGNNLQASALVIDAGLQRHVYQAGNQFQFSEEANLERLDTTDKAEDGFYQFPLAVNPFDGDRLLLGGHSLYESSDNGDTLNLLLTGTTNKVTNPNTGVSNTAGIAYGGRRNNANNPGVVYAGFANATISDANFHIFLRRGAIDTMHQLSDPGFAPGTPGSFMATDIALDPDDWNQVYVTDGSRIFFTADATAGPNIGDGATWSQVLNLPSVGRIRAIETVNLTALGAPAVTGDETLVIGTDAGVFACRNPRAASPSWHRVGVNLPNAPVYDLHYIPAGTSQQPIPTDDVLVVGTLGRGAWLLQGARTTLTQQSVLTITGDTDFAGESDNIRIGFDTNNPALMRLTLNDISFSVPFNSIERIVVDGRGGDDTFTVDFGFLKKPIPTGGIDFAGGSGANTLALVGTPSITPDYQPDPMDSSPAKGTISVSGFITFTGAGFVRGVPPKILTLQIDKTSAVEGDSATITGTFSDPGTLSTHTVTSVWGDLFPAALAIAPLAAGVRQFSVTHRLEEGSPFLIPVTISDDDNPNLRSQTLTVSINVIDPPVVGHGVTIQANSATVNLFSVATFTDPPGAEVEFPIGTPKPPPVFHYNAVINWGDQTTPTPGIITLGGNGGPLGAGGNFGNTSAGVLVVNGNHNYTKGGTYSVTVTINHEGVITVVHSTIVYSQVSTNPKAMLITAAPEGGTIRVTPVGPQTGTSSDVVEVFINGVSQGQFTGFLEIIVIGSTGSDDLEIAPGILKRTILSGGVGDDLLVGGDLNDSLQGGDGNDTLIGNDGNDVLQGGNGNDTLLGGNGNDFLDGGAGSNFLDAGPGQDGVVFYGTDRNERIEIGRQVGPHGAQVVVKNNAATFVEDYINGETVFVFAGKGNDVVKMLPSTDGRWTAEFHGQDGNDMLFGSGMDDFLFGDNGNDFLVGAGGKDVLLGGDGDDQLDGGIGQDVLIGGNDADRLFGISGGDLLIAGRTAFDNDSPALAAILAEWTSQRSYEARVANLRGVGSGARANDSYFLNARGPAATVFDDAAEDRIMGGSDRDWFFARLGGKKKDMLLGLQSGEFVDEV